MIWILGTLVLVAGAVGGAMSVEFRLQPDGPPVSSLPLKGSFYVFADERPEGEARLFLWNATGNTNLALGNPQAKGDGLLWGPIALLRECDAVPEGRPAIIAVPGDLLVAAVDADQGASATARVSTPVGQPRVLKVLNSEGKEVAELCCGTYTLRLVAPDLDVSCEPEEVSFSVISGGKSSSLVLKETGKATGVFTATFRVECLCSSCELSASLAGLALPLNAEVSFVNEELGASSTVRLVFTVAGLCEGNTASVVPPFPVTTEEPAPAPAHAAEGQWEGVTEGASGEPEEKKPLATLAIKPTAAVALPGRDFLVQLEFSLPGGISEASLQVEAPPGWEVRLGGVCDDVLPCPLRVKPDGTARAAVILGVPEDATGRYAIAFSIPELGARWGWELGVGSCLDPREVVRHWDPEKEDLDLSLPGEVTYERLLWAVIHVGERLPFACRVLSQGDLEALAAEWESGGTSGG